MQVRIVIAGIVVGVCVGSSLHGAPAVSVPRVVSIPSLVSPGGVSAAGNISADGRVVVGAAASPKTSNTEAYRWTETEGITGLGDLTGGAFNSFATACSANGSVVTGHAEPGQNSAAFRWTNITGMTGLPSGVGAIGYGVSASGDIVVGSVDYTSTRRATRWVNGVAQSLPFLFPLDNGMDARGVSGDGSVVTGTEDRITGTSVSPVAFRWTQNAGTQALPSLAGGDGSCQAAGVSQDGNVTLGAAIGSAGILEPVRWLGTGTPQRLTTSSGSSVRGIAVRSTGDGSIVIGNLIGGGAFIWDAAYGLRNLSVALNDDYGLATNFYTVGGISTDGLAIAGSDIQNHGFVVYLPEPRSFALAFSLLFLFQRHPRSWRSHFGFGSQS